MTPAIANGPVFRVHSNFAAFARVLWVAVLCAALAAGFLSQVWRGAGAGEAGAPSPAAARAEGTRANAS